MQPAPVSRALGESQNNSNVCMLTAANSLQGDQAWLRASLAELVGLAHSRSYHSWNAFYVRLAGVLYSRWQQGIAD
jgi:hypothetical protein